MGIHGLHSLCLQPACWHCRAIALLFDLIHIFVMHFLKDLHSTKSTFLEQKQDQQLLYPLFSQIWDDLIDARNFIKLIIEAKF